MSIEVHKYKDFSILEDGECKEIFWSRGKEVLSFPISETLLAKAVNSDKDALEVMFYCEYERWPKGDELDSYNRTDIIVHKGDGFVVYEENGKYEIGFNKEMGGSYSKEFTYRITKELMDKAFKSDQDAYEVMIYAETGHWPIRNQAERDDSDREFIRKNPEVLLKAPKENRRLLSEEEFQSLVREAVTVELEPQKIDSMGLVDGHLELLLLDPIGWQEELEGVHLELLQEKLNNYLYFIESKQYAERYGDHVDKKVINITFQHSPSDNGLAFLAAAQKTLSPTDISLKIVLPDE